MYSTVADSELTGDEHGIKGLKDRQMCSKQRAMQHATWLEAHNSYLERGGLNRHS